MDSSMRAATHACRARRRASFALVASIGLAGPVAGCSSVATSATSSAASTAAPVVAERCIVRLHGKGERGAAPTSADGIAELAPTGNADGWGARQWVYEPEARYAEALATVKDSVDAAGCRRVVVDGFSNGASFAASLLCAGETLAGRLVGVVIDDPVADAATAGCHRADGVRVQLYWTGALEHAAPPGTSCATLDWTCEGGTVVGIDDFAASLRTVPTASPFTTHTWYRDAPELREWLRST